MASTSDFAPPTQTSQLGTASSAAHPPPSLNDYPEGYPYDQEILLSYNSSNDTLANTPGNTYSLQGTTPNEMSGAHQNDFTSVGSTNHTDQGLNHWNYDSLWDADNASLQPFGDMMIESQDVDMSMLGLDMMPWFEPTHDFTGLFDTGGQPSPADPNVTATVGGAQSSPQAS